MSEFLERYVPENDWEKQCLARMLSLKANTSNFYSKYQFEPGHFTASAFIASPDRQALLLIFHGKLRRWLQPGGHLEPNDSDLLAAARREVAEEVGLEDLTLGTPGIFDLDIHQIPPTPAQPAHLHFDVRFLFQAKNLEFTSGDDALAAKWFPLSGISEEIADASVMRAVYKLATASIKR